MHLPNRYVFGFGMDVKGAWRNLPAIYAMKLNSGRHHTTALDQPDD